MVAFFLLFGYEKQTFIGCIPVERIHALKLFLHLRNLDMPVVIMTWRDTWVMVPSREAGDKIREFLRLLPWLPTQAGSRF